MESDDDELDLHKIPSSDTKITRIKNQVNNVIDNMKTNIDKVVERGQNLDDLNDRSEQLSASGDLFSKRARTLRKNAFLRTCRARLYLGLTVSVILVLIICKLNISFN